MRTVHCKFSLQEIEEKTKFLLNQGWKNSNLSGPCLGSEFIIFYKHLRKFLIATEELGYPYQSWDEISKELNFPKSSSQVSSQKKCECEPRTLFLQGCQCGGV